MLGFGEGVGWRETKLFKLSRGANKEFVHEENAVDHISLVVLC